MQGIDFQKELNPEQYAAVMAPDGPILVLAAAGTGKTRTLVYRVAHLVERGISPEQILLLTFTNRAAREMLERARNLVGPAVAGVWGGTFHHLANRVLRRYAGLIGYGNDYTILDRDDSRTLVGQCIKELKLQSKDFPKRDVLLGLFGTASNTGAPVEDVVHARFEHEAVNEESVLAVHRGYEGRKKKLDALDFDDLLVKCLQLFRKHPEVLRVYHDRFEHVLVDEYQDTNPLQAGIVDGIAGARGNVMVVGDDFQSIYSWRGADFRNIMSFPERYPGTTIYKLETNYRSVPEVLQVANACIAGNPDQYQKVLRPTREAYKKPILVRLRDGDEQSRFVVEHIRNLRRSGYPYSDIAILYRAHYHAMEIQLALTRENIPYVITSGVRFFEQAHIKDVCSFLRVLESPEDEMAFTRLMALFPGIGEKTAMRLWDKLGGRFEALDAGRRQELGGMLKGEARIGWGRISPIFEACASGDIRNKGGEIIFRFVTAFYDHYAVNTFENADRRLDDVRELGLYTTKYESLEAFLSDVALLTNLDAEDENIHAPEGDAIRLSTVHQAKGLEWSAVIMLWLADGMFPSSRSMDESSFGESEERRLFYVSVTRAKDELCLCVPELRRTRDGGVMYCLPSRFVQEIPVELVKKVSPGFL